MKFAAVGGTGVVVNLLVVALCDHVVFADLGTRTLGPLGIVELGRFLSLVAGILVSIFTNFLLNDRWTWGDRDKGAGLDWVRRCRDFYVTNGIAAGLQLAVAWAVVATTLFERHLFGFDLAPHETMLASLAGIAIATPLNFVVNHLWTFRERD